MYEQMFETWDEVLHKFVHAARYVGDGGWLHV
jgi:hypothetical protein